jgi:hypothetical protein
VNKIQLIPDSAGYSAGEASGVDGSGVAGPALLMRRSYINNAALVDVQWTLNPSEYTYLYKAYRVSEIGGNPPFLIDMILDNPLLMEYIAKFVAGSFRLASHTGSIFTVTAKLYVTATDGAPSMPPYPGSPYPVSLGPPDPYWESVILLMPFVNSVTEDVNDFRTNTLATDTSGLAAPPVLDFSDVAFPGEAGGSMYTSQGDASAVVVNHADPWMAASGQPLTIELFYKPISKGSSQGTGSVFRNAFCGWATGYPFTTGNADSFLWINQGSSQLGYHNSGFFGSLTMGTWNHVAIIYDPAGGATPLSVYSNGTRFIHTGAGASMPSWRAFAFGNCGRLGALFDGSYAAYLPTTHIGPIRVSRMVRYSGNTYAVPPATFPTYGP